MSVASPLDPKQNDGFKEKNVGDTVIKKAVERILALEEKKDQAVSDLKGAYDDAAEKGVDRRALKDVVKLQKKTRSPEHMQTVNSYLKALGELPLFANMEIH